MRASLPAAMQNGTAPKAGIQMTLAQNPPPPKKRFKLYNFRIAHVVLVV
jgi:hypothetical protein